MCRAGVIVSHRCVCCCCVVVVVVVVVVSSVHHWQKRVPMGQSVQYYYGLRAKGVECKMLIYNMSHALSDNVEQKANYVVNVVKWFLDHE